MGSCPDSKFFDIAFGGGFQFFNVLPGSGDATALQPRVIGTRNRHIRVTRLGPNTTKNNRTKTYQFPVKIPCQLSIRLTIYFIKLIINLQIADFNL